jgi:membrane protein YdbS with pleckstrin-like domain
VDTVRLRAPGNHVDPRAKRWWTVQALVMPSGPMLAIALTMTTLSLLFFPSAMVWLGPLLAAVLAIPALVYLLLMPGWRYRVHAWELGDSSVYSATGWWWQRARITPLSRVQTVDTVSGPIQQSFGLSTVIITTASTAGNVRISGLSREDAQTLADRIGEAAQRETGDAT